MLFYYVVVLIAFSFVATEATFVFLLYTTVKLETFLE